MTRIIPGYDRAAVTLEDVQEYRKEAERRGHVYEQFIDGDHDPNGEGALFRGDTEDEALRDAYWSAWRRSCTLDGIDTLDAVHYPTHGYKLYHRQGNQRRLLVDYTPPNPEDVASGKVVMPSARARDGYPYRSH